MFDYTNKVVAITGASSGIGLEIARQFYLAGASLALCSRSEERVRDAITDWATENDRILVMSVDTSKVEDIYAFRDASAERFGQIDVWVNNAGIERPMPTVEMTPDIFNAVVDTNFRGYYFGCQCAAQDMLRRKAPGAIINIGSVNAITVVPDDKALCPGVGQGQHSGKLRGSRQYSYENQRGEVQRSCRTSGDV